jgi:long-subunit fatty acid transport protein
MHLSLIAYNSQTILDNLIIGVSYNWEFHSLWAVFEFSFVTKNFPKKISQK